MRKNLKIVLKCRRDWFGGFGALECGKFFFGKSIDIFKTN